MAPSPYTSARASSLPNVPTRLFRRHETCGANDRASIGLGAKFDGLSTGTADS